MESFKTQPARQHVTQDMLKTIASAAQHPSHICKEVIAHQPVQLDTLNITTFVAHLIATAAIRILQTIAMVAC